MTSVVLYHGPGAEGAAHAAAAVYGLVVPFRESGEALKKDDVRELVALLNQTPVGSRPWSVVVGPVDEISTAVADVLLKTLEEYVEVRIRPFLWARDQGGVIPTIRSRCLQEFVPGLDERVTLCRPQAERLVSSFVQKNWTGIVSDLKESKGDEEYVLLALAEVIQSRLGEEQVRTDLLNLWKNLRALLEVREAPLTPARVLSVFLAEVQ